MLIVHAHILYSSVFFQFRSENCASKSADLLHIAQIYDPLICCPDRGSEACTCTAKPIVRIHTLSLTYTNRIEGNCRKELACEKQPYNSHDLYIVAMKRS